VLGRCFLGRNHHRTQWATRSVSCGE
jgi:hypothetical protein